MEKRLVSDNIFQCSNQTTPEFSSYGSLIAYKTAASIRIHSLNKQFKDTQIKISNNRDPCRYFFNALNAGLTTSVFFVVEYSTQEIQVYAISTEGKEINLQLVSQIKNAKSCTAVRNGIAFQQQGRILKIYQFATQNLASVCQLPGNAQVLQHEGQQLFVLSQTQPSQKNTKNGASPKKLAHFVRNKIGYEQTPLNIDYLSKPVLIYRDKYVFEDVASRKQIQIYNVKQSKMVGIFSYEGDLIKTFIRGNIMLVITTKQNMDRYCFYTLNKQANSSSLLSHRVINEKGKSSYFNLFSCQEAMASLIVQGKSTELSPKNDQTQSSAAILYVLPAKKTKIQVLKVSRSKIQAEDFKEKEIDSVVLSKAQNKSPAPASQKRLKPEGNHQLQAQKARVAASMNHRKGEKSIQDTQKEMINLIVDIKIKGLMQKFDQINQRLDKIQLQIRKIYGKIETSIQNINREQISKNVESLFERVTPQFESYFKQVFRQISGVLDQGVNYYSSKLANQTQIHRQAFNQIVHMTFDATAEIVQLGRKQLDNSQKTSENLEKLLQIRKKWESQTRDIAQNFKQIKNQSMKAPDISLNQPSPAKISTPEAAKKKKNVQF